MLEWLELESNQAAIKGQLDQWQLGKLMPVAPLLSNYRDLLTVDLSEIDKIDSAGIAFLLELKQQAQKVGLKIDFQGSPSALNKLKSLYNLEQLF